VTVFTKTPNPLALREGHLQYTRSDIRHLGIITFIILLQWHIGPIRLGLFVPFVTLMLPLL